MTTPCDPVKYGAGQAGIAFVDQATLPNHTKDKNIFQSCQVTLAEGDVSISPIFPEGQQFAGTLTKNEALVRRFSDGNQERSQDCQARRLKLCYAMKKHFATGSCCTICAHHGMNGCTFSSRIFIFSEFCYGSIDRLGYVRHDCRHSRHCFSGRGFGPRG
jgi:hypothetical protein